jgi:hypothetical protein
MYTTDFDHLAPERERQIVSMGFVCGTLRILPGQLKVLMEACDIKFSQLVDGVGYLSVADAEEVARKCRDVLKEIHDASVSYKAN